MFEANLFPRPTNAGAYSLTARAFDSSGEFATSAPRTLNIAPEPSAPMVTTGGATFPTSSTSAELVGTVTANGDLSGGYSVYFQVGLSTSYGSFKAYWPGYIGGGEPVAISLPITNLARGTTYHYRLVVRYVNSITYGEDATFTTPLNFAPTAKDKLIVLADAGPQPVYF